MTPVLKRIRKFKVKTPGQTPGMLDADRQFVLIQDTDRTLLNLLATTNSDCYHSPAGTKCGLPFSGCNISDASVE